METYSAIIRNLATDFTHAYDTIGDIESEPGKFLIEPYEDDESIESFFTTAHDPFTHGIIEMYTSFELFLSELIQQKLREWVDCRRIYSHSPVLKDKIRQIMEHVNQGDKSIVNTFEDEYDLTMCDRIELLGVLGVSKQDCYAVYHQTKIIRNGIVHRGKTADFEEYANVFITLGKLFIKYDNLSKQTNA